MRTLLNVIWLVLSGFWLALGYAFAGVIMTVLIVTIPFGIASFRLAGFVLWPFGRTVVRTPDGGGVLEVVFNVVWLVLAGWGIFLATLVAGLLLCITIIGIPFGIQAFKLSTLALWPFGRTVVDD